MDNRLYLIDLYDLYGELLTDKQQSYFEDYYFDNLTLQEIAENSDVSRNAIHKQIKEAEDKLNHFE
ncbi:MAG: HTH domain-containing protein, partial [Bacilli bacterium]|nr:HTH domain-containing protein [Bacilli bacterium]